MKKIVIMAILFVSAISTSNVQAQNSKNAEATIKVYGNCGECKERILEAVYDVKGVKKANWDKVSKMLTVVYNTNKCTLTDIEAATAKVGHDTDNIKSSDKVYQSLPACCAYRNGGTCNH